MMNPKCSNENTIFEWNSTQWFSFEIYGTEWMQSDFVQVMEKVSIILLFSLKVREWTVGEMGFSVSQKENYIEIIG